MPPAPDPKRRLTVLKPVEDEGEEARPPWQWVGFGTAAIFAAWLPLAYAAEALKSRLFAARLGSAETPDAIALALAALTPRERLQLDVMTVLLLVVPLALAAFAGGFLVGRWGRGAGVREAALGGLAAALIASALSCAEAGASAAPLVSVAIATPLAAWGGRVGRVRRERVHGPDA